VLADDIEAATRIERQFPGREDDQETWPSFAGMYHQCFPAVLRYILSRTGEPAVAEDLAGDTFERALQSWPRFEGRSRPTTWVLGIARHVVIDYLRQSKVRTVSWQQIPGESATDTDEPAGTMAQRSAERLHLQAAISRLPDAEQDVVLLRYAGDLSFREIGRLLRIREGAARTRVYRALRHLRAILEEGDALERTSDER
jgi:RNA polymerase sigma factor (sigma-70 family)